MALPRVDGNLMVRAIAMMEAPHAEVPDIKYLEKQYFDLEARRAEYSVAGFDALAQKIQREDMVEVWAKKTHAEYLKILQEWRDRGFFVINTPEWTNTKIVNGVEIPFMLASRTSWRNLMSMHQDYQALFCVLIRNFVGDVPLSVVEACSQFRNSFDELGIMFVAKMSAIENLVRNFVREDPVLVGMIHNCPDHMVVLKMWGEDLNEISLTLLDEASEGVNEWR